MVKFNQIYPQTVVKRIKNNTQTKFWVSGFKIDKYANNEGQNIHGAYLEPIELEVKIGKNVTRWTVDECSLDNLLVILPDGQELQRWQANQRGIKFFKTEEDAEKYFLFMVNKVYTLTRPIDKLYHDVFKKLSYISPDFLKDNDIENNTIRW